MKGEEVEPIMMNVLYNSPTYVVVEYSGQEGIELVDKAAGRARSSKV